MLTLAIVLGVACVMLLTMLFFAKSFVAWASSTVIPVFYCMHLTYDMFINPSLLESDGTTNTTISPERTMVSFKNCIFAE